MREIDGKKIAFVSSESYFASFAGSPSMFSTARDTGADIVFLLAPGKTEADLSDEDLRTVLRQSEGATP